MGDSDVLIAVGLALVVASCAYFAYNRRRSKLEAKRTGLRSSSECTPFGALCSDLAEAARQLGKHRKMRAAAEQCSELAIDCSQPLLVVVMGNFKSGKSTLLNVLLGTELLVTDVTPATAAVTKLVYDDQPRLLACYGRKQRELGMDQLEQVSAEGDAEGCRLRKGLRYLEVHCDSPILRNMVLVDTPGLIVSVRGNHLFG